MSDDVQAAAERLRRLYNANDSYAEVYGVEQTGAGLQQRDEQAVVAAYLALHDPTPLDETWLRAVGFEVDVRAERRRCFSTGCGSASNGSSGRRGLKPA
jgi:hypothetical protein